MKIVFLILLGLLGGCVSGFNKTLKEVSHLVGYRDLNYWVEYGQDIISWNERKLLKSRISASKKLESRDWVDCFEGALILGLRPKSLKDYRRSLNALAALSTRQDLDEASSLAVDWYRLQIHSNRVLAEKSEKYRLQSEELDEKLKGLSKIEQKIQKRSQRIVH